MGNGSTGPQILQYKFSGARFQTCHCEEGESPTRQSREGTYSSHKPPLKWCVPIASVAALTAQPLAALPPYGCGVPFTGGERHGGLQYAPHCLHGARLSDLSLRGAKRRGNLAEPDRTTGKSSAKSQLPSRDCTPRALPRASRSGRHVGLRPPRNDKSGPQCHFNDSLSKSAVPSRDCHVASLLAMTNLWRSSFC